jgi:hypothetical protein
MGDNAMHEQQKRRHKRWQERHSGLVSLVLAIVLPLAERLYGRYAQKNAQQLVPVSIHRVIIVGNECDCAPALTDGLLGDLTVGVTITMISVAMV